MEAHRFMLGGPLISHEGVLPSRLPFLLLRHTHTAIMTGLRCLSKRLCYHLLSVKISGKCQRR